MRAPSSLVRLRPGLLMRTGGFTLMELMVVVVILGILAAIVVRNVAGRVPQARIAQLKTQMREFENALDTYKLDNGDYPTTEQGLQALVTKPASGKIPANYQEGGYMKVIPKDPWGNEYVFIRRNVGKWEYEILSYGRDGREGGEGEDKDWVNHEMFE